MPVDPKTQFLFEFDKSGRMRLVNTDKSMEFLEQVDKHESLEILLGAQTSPPNLVPNCGEGKIPMPLRATGCFNEICPIDIKLKLTPLIQEEWTNTMIERSGGG